MRADKSRLAARVELVAEDRRRQRRVDESRRDQVHAYGCELERKALRQRGQRSGDRGDERAGARATPSGAADEQQTTSCFSLHLDLCSVSCVHEETSWCPASMSYVAPVSAVCG